MNPIAVNPKQRSIIIEELIDEEAFMANLPSVDEIKMIVKISDDMSDEIDLLEFDY